MTKYPHELHFFWIVVSFIILLFGAGGVYYNTIVYPTTITVNTNWCTTYTKVLDPFPQTIIYIIVMGIGISGVVYFAFLDLASMQKPEQKETICPHCGRAFIMEKVDGAK